ncbi:MAG: alpha-galactosidase [Treponema sp.]|nr:alpha-galactosidase [Treponema sp.]
MKNLNGKAVLRFTWAEKAEFSSGGFSFALAPPCVEIDGVPLNARPDLRQTEEAGVYRYILSEKAEALMEMRSYPGFARLRYLLKGEGAELTKSKGKDNFSYTGFEIPGDSKITEVQINQYDATRHAYLPQILERPEAEWLGELSLAGPILLAEWIPRPGKKHTLLCAYEHGGQYTDDFLKFNLRRGDDVFNVSLECGDGTYCNKTCFSDAKPYVTPWFQIGFREGGREDMLRAYRNFMLHDMGETLSARTPYVFYNTWNNQERNRAFRGRRYLQDMNTERMLKEIDLAHRIGIDVFVIDTGWYKNTGDWEVDLDRFPDDLGEIRSRLESYGMKLGLWFNPSAAAVSSQISREHPEYRKQLEGKDVNVGPVWETEESYSMCLASPYADWLIEKLAGIGERYGVRYFKWDAVDMSGCTAPHHNHGGEGVSPEEREKNFRFRCGLSLTRIASELSRRLPGAIVDLDVTEGRRYVGLGFLAAGKFFHMNNGPYYHDFDIPNARDTYRENWNVFFYPGSARNHVCRQSLAYDAIIPSLLFLTHFLPDGPSWARQNALASLCLGGNGIWGDLHSLSGADIEEISFCVNSYKRVARDVTEAYPVVSGFIGASPEIHEKINPETGMGLVAFFTGEPVDVVYCTQALDTIPSVSGADEWEKLESGRVKICMKLKRNDARLVFFG